MPNGDRPSFTSFPEVVRRHAAASSDGLAFRYLVDGDSESRDMTCGELDAHAWEIAALLYPRNVATSWSTEVPKHHPLSRPDRA